MERSRRAGIATFVMRDREYLVAIFSEDGLLRAETLRFAAEVRSSSDVGLPRRVNPEPRVLKQVSSAVQSLEESRWTRRELSDSHEALRKLAQAKLRRKKDVVVADEGSAGAGAQVIDLMEVLRKSLAESGLARTAKARPKTRNSAAKRTAAHHPR